MLDRQDITKRVEAELQRYIHNKIDEAQDLGAGYVRLWREIDTHIQAGGKRIRPYLALLAYQAYGGSDLDRVVPVACAWEILHASLLIHDDIIDRDTMRHNQLNIAGTYERHYRERGAADAEHYALSAALLAGDLLIAASSDIVMQSDLTAVDKMSVLKFLHRAVYLVGGGELIDVESTLQAIDDVEVDKIAYYKTATYSFQLPLICGAQLAQAPKDDILQIEQLGREIGLAFQMQDDLLGVFGSEQTTGKSNRSDIYEKKRTLLMQFTRAELSNNQAERLDALFAKEHELNETEANEVFTMITSTSARTQLEQHIETHSKKAKELVDTLGIGTGYKKILIGLVDKLAVRKS